VENAKVSSPAMMNNGRDRTTSTNSSGKLTTKTSNSAITTSSLTLLVAAVAIGFLLFGKQ
jgi:hypothetical protein